MQKLSGREKSCSLLMRPTTILSCHGKDDQAGGCAFFNNVPPCRCFRCWDTTSLHNGRLLPNVHVQITFPFAGQCSAEGWVQHIHELMQPRILSEQ